MPLSSPEAITQLGEIAVSIRHLEDKYESLTLQQRDANEHTQRKIEKVLAVLNGDGDAANGVVVRLHRIEDRVGHLETREKSADDWRKWATRLVLGACILGVLSVIGFSLKATFASEKERRVEERAK